MRSSDSGSLNPIPVIKQTTWSVRLYIPSLQCLQCTGHADGACRLGKDTFLFCQPTLRFVSQFIVDQVSRAARRPASGDHFVAIDEAGDLQAADRCRAVDAATFAGALPKRPGHGVVPFRLHTMDGRSAVDFTALYELGITTCGCHRQPSAARLDENMIDLAAVDLTRPGLFLPIRKQSFAPLPCPPRNT